MAGQANVRMDDVRHMKPYIKKLFEQSGLTVVGTGVTKVPAVKISLKGEPNFVTPNNLGGVPIVVEVVGKSKAYKK